MSVRAGVLRGHLRQFAEVKQRVSPDRPVVFLACPGCQMRGARSTFYPFELRTDVDSYRGTDASPDHDHAFFCTDRDWITVHADVGIKEISPFGVRGASRGGSVRIR